MWPPLCKVKVGGWLMIVSKQEILVFVALTLSSFSAYAGDQSVDRRPVVAQVTSASGEFLIANKKAKVGDVIYAGDELRIIKPGVQVGMVMASGDALSSSGPHRLVFDKELVAAVTREKGVAEDIKNTLSSVFRFSKGKLEGNPPEDHEASPTGNAEEAEGAQEQDLRHTTTLGVRG